MLEGEAWSQKHLMIDFKQRFEEGRDFLAALPDVANHKKLNQVPQVEVDGSTVGDSGKLTRGAGLLQEQPSPVFFGVV